MGYFSNNLRDFGILGPPFKSLKRLWKLVPLSAWSIETWGGMSRIRVDSTRHLLYMWPHGFRDADFNGFPITSLSELLIHRGVPF